MKTNKMLFTIGLLSSLSLFASKASAEEYQYKEEHSHSSSSDSSGAYKEENTRSRTDVYKNRAPAIDSTTTYRKEEHTRSRNTDVYNSDRARLVDPSGMREDDDGVLEKNEYEYISTNQSITRSWCPYACSTRGIPRKDCRTWRSIQDPSKCYVQDLRLPSSAIEFR